VVRKGEKHADERDSVTIFTFPLQTGFNWWSGRGNGTQIKGTVSRYSHFNYWLQLVVRKGERHADKRGQCHDTHISIKLASTGGQEGGKARG
jgi:hypothetical protein